MENLWQRLHKDVLNELEKNKAEYPEAVASIKKSFSNKTLWSDLTVEEVRRLRLFGFDDLKPNLDVLNVLYGTNFLKDD